MILCDRVEVKVNNTGIYRDLGYDCEFGDILSIALSHLPKKSHTKVPCKCDDCGTKFLRRFCIINSDTTHFCRFCSRKRVYDAINLLGQNVRTGSAHHNWNPNKSEFHAYAYQVRLLTEKIYRLHKQIINPHNFPRTKCGVEGGYQLDHKVSVKEGFERNLPIHEVAHINNLQIMSWKENRSKGA